MDAQMKIMVIQGPNINMLGKRETNIYGSMSMENIHEQMKTVADQAGVEIEFFQSNFEGEIVDKIQECLGEFDGIIINPAAYTHSSIAIRDAISAVKLPVIEVHISNVYQREEFRQKSLIAPVCAGQIIGFGPVGYHLAMMGMLQIFEQIKAVRARQQNA
ncbi:type II 3-dehydroquinate dehydratase [Campylobacter fetus]|uniref:3-dehydroquinate dehydratase n=4 Tax=Campylobacteraceae TaxID=72294 RepID=A0A5L4ILP8_CAMFE|nr:3-dehydroquinate dehydratase, type II [Campylobacter fetus subsp. fetus 82-40]AHE94820.1 3-dehydroquinate dehydratase [Campylobacter fetus subsp. venerealis cfvi03/293]AIR79378.1 3-dehydroquinate dehydratase [Campylobacter fetus subsp. fetus 04/554]AIR81237.1 3-dehydroquinate dehydratase [Campylobacter fetus subsp. venerealis 97/608]EAH8300542.1 type II 3-dehydroquinate dehydratase [Campylobacter fetus]EGU24591.1 3-dehydroquinate dehydratase [Campylobacter fetus subsp. venerealis NCTC 10354